MGEWTVGRRKTFMASPSLGPGGRQRRPRARAGTEEVHLQAGMPAASLAYLEPGQEGRADARLVDLAHELRNPLAIILLCSEQLSRRSEALEAPGPSARKLESILRAAEEMHVTSAHGTDLRVRLADAFTACSWGGTSGPGTFAHYPGGLVVAFPAAGTVDGRVVLAPGDINLTFKTYLQSEVRLVLERDRVVAIEGDGLDAELLRSYLAAFDEEEAYAVSHVGWGMHRGARWDALAMVDKADTNGLEARVFAGCFLFSTGANENAGRFTRGHFDFPMRHCSIALDGDLVVDEGHLLGELA